MINRIYQLVRPKLVAVKYSDLPFEQDEIIVRPRYMSICHADQRYYWGQRSSDVLQKKLPMALIHECCGIVEFDPSGTFLPGQLVVMIPNIPPPQYPEYIYENYAIGAHFRSSGYDGFMQELVSISPDRVLPVKGIQPLTAAIIEFVSVAIHAVSRFILTSHTQKNSIGIWGDGGLSYVLANVLRHKLPQARIIIVGRHPEKLSMFTFAQQTELSDNLPVQFAVDHAFDCTGGEGSTYAIDDIIRTIRPQGTVMLLGVTENKVPIDTRNILEKGLNFIGCSRSGRNDFIEALDTVSDPKVQRYLEAIISDSGVVRTISDIHRVFLEDLNNPFKTSFVFDI